MSSRLQVVVDDSELQRFRHAAAASGLTISEWARQVLRNAERHVDGGDPERKLSAIRAAARHEFPTGEIAEILDDIQRGRSQALPE